MLRSVTKVYKPTGPMKRVTMNLKCGHITRRSHRPGRLWTRVHCTLCTFLEKERGDREERRTKKKAKKAARKLRQQAKVEKLMAKKAAAKSSKKMASKKVVKKADLKKVSKTKRTKSDKPKTGRKWFLAPHTYAAKGTLLKKVLDAFNKADSKTIGENELIAQLEKAGVKAEGKKTVKRLVKGVLRNMSRAGVIVKQRDVKNIPEFAEADEDDDEDEDASGEDESTDDADESDEDEEDEDDDEEEDEPKKKVVKKKSKK